MIFSWCSRVRAQVVLFSSLRCDEFLSYFFGPGVRGSFTLWLFMWDILKYFERHGIVRCRWGGAIVIGFSPYHLFDLDRMSWLTRLAIGICPSSIRKRWKEAYPFKNFMPRYPCVSIVYLGVLRRKRTSGVATRLVRDFALVHKLPIIAETGSSLMVEIMTSWGFQCQESAKLGNGHNVHLLVRQL